LAFNGSWWFILKLFIGIILFGILGGLYPVFYLSSLKINSFLQGNTSIKRRGLLRKGLVLFQLLIAIPLIFLSVFIISQINYLNDKDVGFEKENLMLAWVDTPTIEDKERLGVMKNTLLQNPNIVNYSISRGAPFFSSGKEKEMNWEDRSTNDKIRFITYSVDYNFLDTYNMTLKNGRWFSETYSTDLQSACVINETAAALLGWNDPIGKTIDNGRLKVIGVVKDFNQFSLFQKIPPMVLSMDAELKDYSLVSIKINPNDRSGTLGTVNNLFNANFLDAPIEFKFLDVGFDEGFMSALENVMRIFILFSVISVLLVIIGLYSLIAFSLRMQKKMIAIRKVMGATTKGLFLFIMKEYLILYGIAITISLISTYFVVLQVSKVFAYSVGIKLMNFVIVILLTFIIVLITVSGKIWSASRQNPIDEINRS
jgi:putative ABC transport system permease protein